MKALELDPGDYAGTYKLVGGRMSLDMVNTVSWPDSPRQHDWLDTTSNLYSWLRAAGLASPSPARLNLNEAAHVRRSLTAMLRPLAHGNQPSAATMREFNHLLAVSSRPFVHPGALDWSWPKPHTTSEALSPVVADAADLVVSGDHDRLRHCPSCDWLFEDRSRNSRRRWCDMNDCGSRAKSRAFYQRHKS